MNDKNMQTVEINGVKVEVDLREAKVIEKYKVGDPVQVLIKEYNDSYKVFPGIIVAFHLFKQLPTIVIVYLNTSYNSAEMHTVYLNEKSKNIEIAPSEKLELTINKADAIKYFVMEIDKKKNEIKELVAQFNYFKTHFNQHFKDFTVEDDLNKLLKDVDLK